MPANDSMQHRGASAVRGGRRFAPYRATDGPGPLKPHATFPSLSIAQNCAVFVSSPEDSSIDCPTEISSTATLVNSSFECDSKFESSPTPLLLDCGFKSCEKAPKFQQRQALHQKKVDYVSQLIDFACLNLNEIWPLASIPPAFRYQHGATFGYTPETTGVPVEDFKSRKCETDLIPLRKFVQELLRRSRSTCSTLQTALCYIEAIRHKIPAFQKAELEGRGLRGDQVNNEGRIEVDDCCLDFDDEYDAVSDGQSLKSSKFRKNPSPPDTPLPQLPSALLCPRRAFMGALVLSAKFVQDKCYSNRAWAKLCGLPAREVSRCERALGDALEWRLWVGKDKTFPFASLESKLGRAPTMLQSCPAIDNDFLVERRIPTPLARAQTWPLIDKEETPSPFATLLIPSEGEAFASPTPSLTYSSGGSSCSSGTLSPYPSPLPSFVPNDPCSNASKLEITRMRLASFLNNAALNTSAYTTCGSFYGPDHEQDAFGIRGGDAIQVV